MSAINTVGKTMLFCEKVRERFPKVSERNSSKYLRNSRHAGVFCIFCELLFVVLFVKENNFHSFTSSGNFQ